MRVIRHLSFVVSLLVGIILFVVFPLSMSKVSAHPANGNIVFDSNKDTSFGEVYSINQAGTIINRLTNDTEYDGTPFYSPDGSKIVFYSTLGSGNPQVYTMNADGSSLTQLTNGARNDSGPYSPDGSKIVFTSFRDGNAEIYVMNSDGTNQTRLTNNAVANTEPSWSPDGAKIMFVEYAANFSSSTVYTMNADGNGKTPVTNDISNNYSKPFWSPKGDKIGFISYRDGNSEIYTMNPDGTNITRITHTSEDEDSASYSPDGTKIVFNQYDPNYTTLHIFTIDADGGSSITQLTTTGTRNYSPQWQPIPIGTEITHNNGSTTTTVSALQNYFLIGYNVIANETLVLDGTLCDVVVESGGTLIGTGSIAPDCTLTIEPGGTLAPGHSPGCLASGNLVLSGTLQAEIAGTTACTGYDQLQVTGTVNLTGSILTPVLLNNFTPAAGTVFTLIQNDNPNNVADPVTGTFANLPEGSTLTIANSVFKISYVGGDGNDVTLTAAAVPGAPETGAGKDISLISTFAIAGIFVLSALVIFACMFKKDTISQRSHGK